MSDSLPTLFSEDELDAVLPQNEIKKDPLPPKDSFPESALEHFHPNIVDRLTLLWGYPECLNLLDSLTVDSRGGRQGFRPEVLAELMFLHTILPAKSEPSPWEGGNMKRNWR